MATRTTERAPRKSSIDTSLPFPAHHLLGVQDVPASHLRRVLDRARQLESMPAEKAAKILAGRAVANLLFEDSTRTRTSFTVAAQRLGARIIDLNTAASSVTKGETLVDTALNIRAMGVDAMVVRARQSGAPHQIAEALDADRQLPGAPRCSVLNAGDGKHEHPTQALLDIYTLCRAREEAGDPRRAEFDLSGLTLAIVGDCVSSRVARSNIAAFTALGGRVILVGPPALAPESMTALAPKGACRVSRSIREALPEADGVMVLRMQFERHDAGGAHAAPGAVKASGVIASVREYREDFALTRDRAAMLRPGAFVMHPGPMNRGLEIDADVADGPRSLVLRQVAAGVVVRMAALDLCVHAV
jgi:aspartate carbamoyltransferase catalytic subunit